MTLYTRGINSIIGELTLIADDNALLEIRYKKSKKKDKSPLLDLAQKELNAYFKGSLTKFTTPIRLEGTEYQLRCWKQLRKIKYGKTVSYKEQGISIAGANHSRAVAGANNKNKLSIIVPCHRVIGSNGDFVGYAGGLKIKEILLGIEQNIH